MREAYTHIESGWRRDAQGGGADAFLRHFCDQRGALVLSESEVSAISAAVLSAQDAQLFAVRQTPSLRRQAWRLQQFAETWALYLSYREAVQARQVVPAYTDRLAALRHLTAVETTYATKEAAFNRVWGAYGQPVRWSGFPAENPRAQWSERYLVEGDPLPLEAWAKTDVPNGWLAYRVAQQSDAPVAYRHDFSSPATKETLDLAPHAKNRVERLPAGLRLIAPAGRLGPVAVPIALRASQLVRLQLWTWAERLDVAETQVRVTLRFKGPGRASEVTQVCHPRQTVVPAMTPTWATALEYEIAFSRGAFIQEATVQLIDLPASSAR